MTAKTSAISPVRLRRSGRRKVVNGVFVFFCGVATIVALSALAAILVSLIGQGVAGLDVAIFTKSTPAPGSSGGLANAIVGTIMLCAMAMVIAIAVGVLAGTWLAEYGGEGWYARIIRFVNDVLLSAPSILIGLFVYEIMVRRFIHGFSGYAGAVALAIIAIPVVTRTTEDVLKLQPTALRESGIALGAPVWTTIRRILWKASLGGIVTGGLLAFARISGETAPLLFTALNNQFFSWNMGKPMANLPVVIFNFALSAYDDWRRLAWVGAILITAAVLAAQIIARILIREPKRS
jgi:phosphate transport system permease protein